MSPSRTAQPSRSSAQYSSSSSAGTADRGTKSSWPRRGSSASRPATPGSRTIGAASVPARRTISRSTPATVTRAPSGNNAARGSATRNDPSSPCGRPIRPAGSRSLDNVDEDTLVLAHRRRLDHRAQRVGGPAAAADDLAVVVLGDRDLEHDGAVVLLELLDRDLPGLVDEALGQLLEQLAHGVRLRGDVLRLEQLAHRVRRLGALLQPGPDALLVEHDRRGLGLGVVVADGLDDPAVARRALIGDDAPPHGVLARADASEAKTNGHKRRSRVAASAAA